MIENSQLVRGVADTALWVAYFRACESKRSDAIFRDPFAERLAGERGFQIANTLREGNKQEWVWVARTYLCDRFLERKIQEGADLVLNLAAGILTIPATSHQYLDDNPTNTASDVYPIGVTLTDDDTGSVTCNTTTTITNVAPLLAT